MNDSCDHLNECHHRFDRIDDKLDTLDIAIRGNGKPGLERRVTLLEVAAASSRRLLWLLIGTAVGTAASTIATLLLALARGEVRP